MQDAINESTLRNRAKVSADYLLKEVIDFDKAKTQNTYEGWQEYLDSLDDLDLSEMAYSEADSWDWVIYNGKALDLCANVYGSTLSEAESNYIECNQEVQGLYEMACGIAYWIVFQAVSDELELQREGLREFAESLQEGTK